MAFLWLLSSVSTVLLPSPYLKVYLNSIAKASQCLCHRVCTRSAYLPSEWEILWLQGRLLCFPEVVGQRTQPCTPRTGFHETISILDVGQGRGTREALFSIALHHQVSQSVTRSCTQNLSFVLFLPVVIVWDHRRELRSLLVDSDSGTLIPGYSVQEGEGRCRWW